MGVARLRIAQSSGGVARGFQLSRTRRRPTVRRALRWAPRAVPEGGGDGEQEQKPSDSLQPAGSDAGGETEGGFKSWEWFFDQVRI